MEEMTLNISLSKVIELLLAEQKADIKKFYVTTISQQAGDMLDQFVPSESTILTIIKSLN